ncbi:MAG: hypothetical protein APR63_03380 [Desulfuromonas sp. SDB]|nr:MAG: hypothetical protein APR63_03380 [Desulfuromonas sp. SDB]
MKKLFLIQLGLVILLSLGLNGQNLLNLPESVVYDSLRCRYLVSNWGDGHLVQIDSMGVQSYFIENEHCHAGLIIVDTVVYAACREYGVRGFNLSNGQKICDVPIPGAGNINDITSDTSGFIYVSYPTASKIYQVDPVQQTYSVILDYNLNTPNGIYFDPTFNRIIIVSYRINTPIQALYLSDTTIQTINYPNLHNLDGITCDENLNYYVSSWYTNAVHQMDSSFSSAQVLATFADDPADIYYNPVDQIIAVPLIFSNQIEFIPLTTPVEEIDHGQLHKPDWRVCFQDGCLRINLTLEVNAEVGIAIFDLTGRSLSTTETRHLESGEHCIQLSCPHLCTGGYIVRLQAGDDIYCKFILNI